MVVENGLVRERRLGLTRIHDVDSHLDLTGIGIALPGAIDMHTHLRGLNLSRKEDERSGTLAAAHGGITAVVDMPNTSPEVRTVTVLREKLRALAEKSVVDYGVFVGLPSSAEELRRMLSIEGVVGLKIYPTDFRQLRNEHL